MKKKIAMLLLAMSLVMTACGGNEDAVKENDSQVESTEESSEEESEEESTSEEESEVASEEASVEDESTDDQETVAYAFGTYTDNGYENASLGYAFTAPEGCVVASEQEILALAGISIDNLAGDYSDAMLEYAKQTVVYDLYALYPETSSNVNIAVQNVDTSEITLDYMVEATRAQLESLTSMDVTVAEGTEVVTIAGKEYTKMKTVTNAEGVTMNQELYMIVEEGRIVNITITYTDGNEAEAEAILAGFSEL